MIEFKDPALFVGEIKEIVTLLPSLENIPLFNIGGSGSTSVFLTFKILPKGNTTS